MTEKTVFNLVVIRARDIDVAEKFYSALKLRFTRERHGNGPEHLAAIIRGTVFEIYPLGQSVATTGVRLGFQIESLERAVADTVALGGSVISPPSPSPWGLRAVVTDADGHKIELVEPTQSCE